MCNRLEEAKCPPGCELECRERAPVTLGHGERGNKDGGLQKREGRHRVSSKYDPGKEMGKHRDLGPPPGQKAWPGVLLTVGRS